MGLSCFIVALLWGTAAVILVPLALCLCLCCIGFTTAGITGGSAAAECMACGGGATPACVSCGQSLGAAGLPCSILIGIFLITVIIMLLECSAITNFYCEVISTNSSLCYNSTGTVCFTFFGNGFCE